MYPHFCFWKKKFWNINAHMWDWVMHLMQKNRMVGSFPFSNNFFSVWAVYSVGSCSIRSYTLEVHLRFRKLACLDFWFIFYLSMCFPLPLKNTNVFNFMKMWWNVTDTNFHKLAITFGWFLTSLKAAECLFYVFIDAKYIRNRRLFFRKLSVVFLIFNWWKTVFCGLNDGYR